MSSDPTGRRFLLSRGDVSAQITQVGAALRALTVDGTLLVPPYSDDSPTPSASGVVLVPWPNRIRDGVWNDEGTERKLAISEPALGNASHGLLRFAPYLAEEGDAQADRVTLRATVFPQTGYPYHLDTSVTYALTESGIRVTHELQNVGASPAPAALGSHPFFQIGGVATADLVVRSSGSSRLVLDEQKIPVGETEVDASNDLRAGRRLAEVSLDTTYRGLERGDDGLVRHTLTAPDGRTLTLWQGAGYEWAQVFTTDKYPGQPLAVAIEPMTSPPDAFNSGTDLRRLDPGESWTLEWGVEFSV